MHILRFPLQLCLFLHQLISTTDRLSQTITECSNVLTMILSPWFVWLVKVVHCTLHYICWAKKCHYILRLRVVSLMCLVSLNFFWIFNVKILNGLKKKTIFFFLNSPKKNNVLIFYFKKIILEVKHAGTFQEREDTGSSYTKMLIFFFWACTRSLQYPKMQCYCKYSQQLDKKHANRFL